MRINFTINRSNGNEGTKELLQKSELQQHIVSAGKVILEALIFTVGDPQVSPILLQRFPLSHCLKYIN